MPPATKVFGKHTISTGLTSSTRGRRTFVVPERIAQLYQQAASGTELGL